MPERSRILYGRRRGRSLRKGQKARVEELLPALEIDVENLDIEALFGVGRPLWLEIGFGGGEHLAWQALAHTDVSIIGCEPFMNGVVKLLGTIDADGLDNVRLFRDDARLLVERLPPASLERVFILFPDPWPKARHHKRRIVSDAMLGQLADALVDGAELRIATDDPGYLEWILMQMRRQADFDWQARRPADWRERPDDWPQTRYEAKAVAAGRLCAFLTYRRRPRCTAA